MANALTVQQAMLHALELARRGTGSVSPNPRVGCVILDNGMIIAEGWHARYGYAHAEVVALQQCPQPPASAILVVTLEPCSHTGKTPPCTDAIIASGIRTVVVGMVDPNPAVAGQGIQRLRDAGIDVVVGVEEEHCRWLNRWFTTSITKQRAYLITKVAQSLDGSMTSANGLSHWITSEASRTRVHELRAECDAVMVGIGTVLADNPELTVRFVTGRNPVRMVIDPLARLPLSSRLVQSAVESRVVVWHGPNAAQESLDRLTNAGVYCCTVPTSNDRLDLHALLRTAYTTFSCASILLEGGPATIAEAFRQDVVDELRLHIAPIILGSDVSWSPQWNDAPSLAQRWQLIETNVVDRDIHVTLVPTVR
jgi:diaminohydroxyphosphoribosylaminopyrimidine deaminase / 5-amino-6-(5-phosphoribosylamino)uracil reductase